MKDIRQFIWNTLLIISCSTDAYWLIRLFSIYSSSSSEAHETLLADSWYRLLISYLQNYAVVDISIYLHIYDIRPLKYLSALYSFNIFRAEVIMYLFHSTLQRRHRNDMATQIIDNCCILNSLFGLTAKAISKISSTNSLSLSSQSSSDHWFLHTMGHWGGKRLNVTMSSWYNDDVIKWKYSPPYLPFVRGIHRSPVNSPHKGQWRGALMFFFDRRLIKQFSLQRRGWWFVTPSRPLWRHCNGSSLSTSFRIASFALQ